MSAKQKSLNNSDIDNHSKVITINNINSSKSIKRILTDSDHHVLQELLTKHNDNFHIRSYFNFLQPDPENRSLQGLQKLFYDMFPIEHTRSNIKIEFLRYEILEPINNPTKCIQIGKTYECNIIVHLRLHIGSKGKSYTEDISTLVGSIPYITTSNQFIINGKYRVFVYQMTKSPGILFLTTNTKPTLKITPSSGDWIVCTLESNNLYISINKKKKFSALMFLAALKINETINIDPEDTSDDIMAKINTYDWGIILDQVYQTSVATHSNGQWTMKFNPSLYKKRPITHSIYQNNKIVLDTGAILTNLEYNQSTGDNKILVGLYSAENIIIDGEKKISVGEKITNQNYQYISGDFKYYIINDNCSNVYLNSINASKIYNMSEAILQWAKFNKVNTSKGIDSVLDTFNKNYGVNGRFSFQQIGRSHVKYRLETDKVDDNITSDLMINCFNKLEKYHYSEFKGDNMDSLLHKYINGAGELLLKTMEKQVDKVVQTIKVKLSSLKNVLDMELDSDSAAFKKQYKNKIADAINLRGLLSKLNTYIFRDSHLSNQNTSFSTLSQQSKIVMAISNYGEATGSRPPKQARQFAPRDFGRKCAVQTPEGNSTGFVNYLSIGSRISDDGQIEVAYYKVNNGVVDNSEIVYLNAREDDKKALSFKSELIEKNGSLKWKDDYVLGIYKGKVQYLAPTDIDYIFVHNAQILGINASTIPFPEKQAPYRTLVGSNMCQQTQIDGNHNEIPFIATGAEPFYSKIIQSKSDGVVTSVSASRIVIKSTENNNVEIYKLKTFERSNTNTCWNEIPIVDIGQVVKKYDTIAISSDSKQDQLALGQNIKVCYISGLRTFEDSLVISDELRRTKRLNNISIQCFERVIEETRYGQEYTTPDVSKPSGHLDEVGIVTVGSYVKPGDVIVGVMTPKVSMSSSTKEKNFIQAILGNSAMSEMIENSLHVPNGVEGWVTNVEILTAKNQEKNSRAVLNDFLKFQELKGDYKDTVKILINEFNSKVLDLKYDKTIEGENIKQLSTLIKSNAPSKVKTMAKKLEKYTGDLEQKLVNEYEDIRSGYDLPIGTKFIVRVYIANNAKVQVGDKLTNRAASKGVIGKIVPIENMYYDGKTGEIFEMVAGPLSIVARANQSQIIECMLGACVGALKKQLVDLLDEYQYIRNNTRAGLDDIIKQIAGVIRTLTGRDVEGSSDDIISIANTFVNKGCSWIVGQFNNLGTEQLKILINDAGLPEDCKVEVIKGATGEKLEGRVLSGYQYILKLIHVTSSKFNTRSTGKYKASTDQPVGGKSLGGGQRVGNMEVWALESHGAAYILWELFNLKSDNSYGRKLLMKSLRNNNNISVIFDNLERIGEGKSFYLLQYSLMPAAIELTAQRDENGKKFAQIKLLGDKEILEKSSGEVTKAVTLHYDRGVPIPKGLFCEKIFGSSNEYECNCGKYKSAIYAGVTCDNCEVTVLSKKDQMHRMGHIVLNTKIVNPWIMKNGSKRFAHLLGMNHKQFMRVVNFELYYVDDPKESEFQKGDFIETNKYDEMDHDTVTAYTGAAAVEKLLANIDPVDILKENAKVFNSTDSKTIKNNCIKTNSIALGLYKSDIDLSNVVLSVVPVVPTAKREMYSIFGNLFTTSDFNAHYIIILNRTKRLKNFLEFFEDDGDIAMVRFMSRAIQEAYTDFLIGQQIAANISQNVKSIASIAKGLSGKEGQFRKDLLGKRIDFSGRTVIVSMDYLFNIDYAVIPVEMMCDLLSPRLISLLIEYGIAEDYYFAKELVEAKDNTVIELLKNLIDEEDTMVLLNRQPTLHKFGIMAFKVILGEKNCNAVKLHPLVCSAYNADFDGDQLAVIAVNTEEAKLEAINMLPSNNLISPACSNQSSSKLIMNIGKDMLLGLYFMTHNQNKNKSEVVRRITSDQALTYLIENKVINVYDDVEWFNISDQKYYKTTAGRALIWSLIPNKDIFDFKELDKVIGKKEVSYIVESLTSKTDMENIEIANFLDSVKNLGFIYAEKYTGSFSLFDYPELSISSKYIDGGIEKEKKLLEYYNDGMITKKKFQENNINNWSDALSDISSSIEENINENPLNPFNAIILSKARGGVTNAVQASGIIGGVKGVTGDIVNICGRYNQGIKPHYLVDLSTAARNNCIEVQNNTSAAGYSTRQIISAMNSSIINTIECKSKSVLWLENLYYNNQECISVYDRAFGCTMGETMEIKTSEKNITIEAGVFIDNKIIEIFKANNIFKIPIRPMYDCLAPNGGMCVMCYGLDPATGKPVELGEHVGNVAAQSIGEPSTQLSMRAYHSGGLTTFVDEKNNIEADYSGKLEFYGLKIYEIEGKNINLGKNTSVRILNDSGCILASYKIPYSAHILTEDSVIEKGQAIAEWSNSKKIFAEQDGVCEFHNMIGDVNYEYFDENKIIIKDSKTVPIITITDNKGVVHSYALLPGYIVTVKNKDQIKSGQVISYAHSTKNTIEMIDSLKSVLAVLSVQIPLDCAKLSHISGKISVNNSKKIELSSVSVVDDNGKSHYLGSFSKNNILVDNDQVINKGDRITSGDISIRDLLKYRGIEACYNRFVATLLNEYQVNNIDIIEKHLQLLFANMTKFYYVGPGDKNLIKGINYKRELNSGIAGEYLTKQRRQNILSLMSKKQDFHEYMNISRTILPIKTLALNAEGSFLSSASFQEAVSVLGNILLSGSLGESGGGDKDMLTNTNSANICSAPVPIGMKAVKEIFDEVYADKIYDKLIATR